MLKKQQINKGYTLVELIVSIAILAFIGVAIGGLMSSNTVIFRKSKSEIEVQNVAQDTYNRLSNDLMQAKSIYIEGYTTGSVVEFGSNKVGGSSSVSAVSRGIFVSDTDFNLLNDLGLYGNAVPDGNKLEEQSKKTFTSKTAKEKFNTYYYKLRYMSSEERNLYSDFISSIPAAGGGVTRTTFSSLKDVSGSNPNKYKDIYMTKIVIKYLTPYDAKYDSSGAAPVGTIYDNCTVTYEFDNGYFNESGSRESSWSQTNAKKALVHILTEYEYMDKIESDDEFTDMINYKEAGGYIIPGVVANVDSANNAIGLKIYFAKALADEDNGRKYNSEGIITFRNSNVVKNAK